MLDLSINQIVKPAVKAWFKDKCDSEWFVGELTCIDHRKNYPYRASNSIFDECSLVDPNNKDIIPADLDLSVDQIVEPTIKAWFRSDGSSDWRIGNLHSIDHRNDFPYNCDYVSYKYCKLKLDDLDTSRVTRFELIGKNGRAFVKSCKLGTCHISLQDDCATLKVFIKED